MDGRPRHHWIWVWGPEYYQPDGEPSDHLEPQSEQEPRHGTCHRATRQGDLILLYRTSPASDLAYLFEATTDAFPVGGEGGGIEANWRYMCGYRSLMRFEEPVSFRELREDPRTSDLPPIRRQLQGGVHALDVSAWNSLTQVIREKNSELPALLEQIPPVVTRTFATEETMEQHIVDNLHLFSAFGLDVEPWDPTGGNGRQVSLPTGGRIDILLQDQRSRIFVVELKNRSAQDGDVGQLLHYMQAVQALTPDEPQPVIGLLVAPGMTNSCNLALQQLREMGGVDFPLVCMPLVRLLEGPITPEFSDQAPETYDWALTTEDAQTELEHLQGLSEMLAGVSAMLQDQAEELYALVSNGLLDSEVMGRIESLVEGQRELTALADAEFHHFLDGFYDRYKRTS